MGMAHGFFLKVMARRIIPSEQGLPSKLSENHKIVDFGPSEL